jgi:4-alpha-glucanotransferase
VRLERSSGILLHPTCLPGPFGIGDFGQEARRFVDFLAAAGQTFWQIMPLGPTGYGGSPYATTSAFAGNVSLVSPEGLLASGLLDDSDLERLPSFAESHVGHGEVAASKRTLLEKAFHHFKGRRPGDRVLRRDYERILAPVSGWLEDYALYAALKDCHDGAAWWTWEPALARREPTALATARRDLGDSIEAHRFFQYVFLRQWLELRDYANRRGLRVIGDVPIFVAHDSADVWARRHLWKLDESGQPTVVAGVPPDAFSPSGQRWGSPLYDWTRLREEGFRWWIDRMREALALVDVVRLDHFRGFAACWEVPARDETAEHGSWVEVPGRALLRAISGALGGDLPIVAEDLGTITPDVHELRDQFGFPGMRVLQFAWSGEPDNPHLPHEYTPNVVAYTGTHDNDTVLGWFDHRGSKRATPAERLERERCLRYLGTDGSEISWDFIAAVQSSDAGASMVPLQDVLGLGSAARMNTPGREEGNWAWRFRPGALTPALGERLRAGTESTGRLVRRHSPRRGTGRESRRP